MWMVSTVPFLLGVFEIRCLHSIFMSLDWVWKNFWFQHLSNQRSKLATNPLRWNSCADFLPYFWFPAPVHLNERKDAHLSQEDFENVKEHLNQHMRSSLKRTDVSSNQFVSASFGFFGLMSFEQDPAACNPWCDFGGMHWVHVLLVLFVLKHELIACSWLACW